MVSGCLIHGKAVIHLDSRLSAGFLVEFQLLLRGHCSNIRTSFGEALVAASKHADLGLQSLLEFIRGHLCESAPSQGALHRMPEPVQSDGVLYGSRLRETPQRVVGIELRKRQI